MMASWTWDGAASDGSRWVTIEHDGRVTVTVGATITVATVAIEPGGEIAVSAEIAADDFEAMCMSFLERAVEWRRREAEQREAT